MIESILAAYGTINMVIFVTVMAGLAGAMATNINGGSHAGESWIYHMKHMFDGFVLAAIISLPAVMLMDSWGFDDAQIFAGLVATSVLAPAIFREIKHRGVDGLIGLLSKRGMK